MIRNHTLENSFLYIGLALAFMAVALVVYSLVVPAVQPVVYSPREAALPAPALNRAQQADASRWNAIAGVYKEQRARAADAARWQALANRYLQPAPALTLSRAQQAEASRWQALANTYLPQQTRLTPAQFADAARWTGLASYYGMTPDAISPDLRHALDQ